MAEQKWFQQVLLAEEVLEVRVRIGLIPSRDHVQWLIEVVDPTVERLIDAKSVPHRDLERYRDWRVELFDMLNEQLDDLIEPF